jgi:chromosome segregation ATPase
LSEGLLAIVIAVLGVAINWLRSRSQIQHIRDEADARNKVLLDDATAKVTAAHIEAEARADKQRIEWSDHFFRQTQLLENKLEKAQSDFATKYEQLNAEYTRTVTSNAHMQGQIDHMRIEQVEAGKRSQMRDQQLGEYKAQIEQSNKQILLQSQRLTELEIELTKTRASEASAIETAEGYRRELDKAQEALRDLKRQVEELQTQVEELTQEVQRLRTELDIVKAERDRLHEENARLNALLNPPNSPLVDFDLGKTQKVDTQGITGPFVGATLSTTGEVIEVLPK